MKESIDTQKFLIRLIEPGILENIARKGNVIDVDDIRALTKINLELANKRDYAVLIDSEEMTSVTMEAMSFSAKTESSVKTIARALMITSLANRIVGNFYLKIKKPMILTKLFTSRIKAIDWLREQLLLHNETKKVIVEEE